MKTATFIFGHCYFMEIWKEIKGTNGRYSVSDLGRLRNNGFYANVCGGGKRFVKGKILSVQLRNGYKTYFIPRLGNRTIHRLVAMHFIDNPFNKEFVNHINGIKTDNRLCNLEWCTRIENENHAYRTGLKNKVPSSVLNEEDVLFILENCFTISTNDLSLKFNVTSSTISRVIKRTIWSHVNYQKPVTPKKGQWKLVMDTNTGVFYESCNQASFAINMGSQSLRKMLRGIYNNKTNMIYV